MSRVTCHYLQILVLMEDVKELFDTRKLSIAYTLVSILVLMEDVKELAAFCITPHTFVVSILVLMEDVKELLELTHQEKMKKCFNPCFNGRCKRT